MKLALYIIAYIEKDRVYSSVRLLYMGDHFPQNCRVQLLHVATYPSIAICDFKMCWICVTVGALPFTLFL